MKNYYQTSNGTINDIVFEGNKWDLRDESLELENPYLKEKPRIAMSNHKRLSGNVKYIPVNEAIKRI